MNVEVRRANDDERGALLFTFGKETGGFLGSRIRIRIGEGESKNLNEVVLPRGYNFEDLSDIGEFIGKAVRVWQQYTGRYIHNKGLESYHYTQLYKLNLNANQHVEAVKDWFYVSYGAITRRIGTGPNRIPFDNLWGRILHVLGISLEHKSGFRYKVIDLHHIVNNHYGCVITELRNRKIPLQP